MNYIKITKEDIANGPGVRTVLWVSGCNCKCKGCHNQSTWDFKAGMLFDEQAERELFSALDRPYIQGITLSGGHPLDPQNIKDCEQLLKKIKILYPEKDVWVYTGYVYEDIKDLSILDYIDVLVDGPFIEEQRDISLPFRGSRNQRIINLHELDKK